MHTTWSDGAATILEMAEAALAMNYRYIGITDHSEGLKIAGGISENELREQGMEIQQVNADFKRSGIDFIVLRSIEANLNVVGEADISSQALADLDLVVGSFHSKLRIKEDQTERYMAALRNPGLDILGHPCGRIYNFRRGLSADWKRVFALAAALDKAVEVDAYPDRQDLNIELLKIARKEGARIAIDTDAHSPEQLCFVELGLAAALVAGIPEERIVNFMSCSELLTWAKTN
jgi:histidinol phosphatase-like PHP family hydrolase